jgi:hypothetical protein
LDVIGNATSYKLMGSNSLSYQLSEIQSRLGADLLPKEIKVPAPEKNKRTDFIKLNGFNPAIYNAWL